MTDSGNADHPAAPAPTGDSQAALPGRAVHAVGQAKRGGRRRRWPTVLLAVVIFFTGAVVGGAATLTLVVHRVQDALASPQHFPQRATARLTRRLGLSEAQAARVQAIFTERQKALFSIRREVMPQVRAEVESLRSEVRNELNDEQRAQWEQIFARLEHQWIRPDRFEERPGGGGPAD
jgi:hypothetical protein